MAAVEQFEQLECWQVARDLVRTVYQASTTGKLSSDFETRSQLKRAGLSTMNNIAEGFGRRFSGKEFIRFLNISVGSAIEVKSMTYMLEDLAYIDGQSIRSIREKAETSIAKTLALIRYLRTRSK
jgi:four helix bundle protein